MVAPQASTRQMSTSMDPRVRRVDDLAVFLRLLIAGYFTVGMRVEMDVFMAGAPLGLVSCWFLEYCFYNQYCM